MKRLALLIATAAIVVFSTQGLAQVLASYNPTGIATNQISLPATSVATGMTATAMTAKSTYVLSGSNEFGLSSSGSVATLAAAVTTTNYFTFTVTPNTGQALNLSAVDLSGNFARQYYSGGTATCYLEASVGNGFGSGAGNILAQWSVTNPTSTGPVVNLSTNSAFQNAAGAVEFRIYVVEPQAYYEDAVGGGGTGANNSINIKGTVSGPTPTNGIATYNPTSIGSGQTSLSATNVAPGLTAGAMATNSTYVTSGSNSFGLSNSRSISSLANAVSTPNYFTFTLTPTSGHTLNISGVDLSGDFARQYYSGGTATYYLEASVGNGFGSGAGNILAQWSVTNPTSTGPVVNLSTNSAFQNAAGAVEFRIYVVEPQAYFEDAVGGGGTGANNSIVVNGAVSGSGGVWNSTTGAATIYFPSTTSGPVNTSNWESSDYTGTAYRQWDSTGDSFTFTWDTITGDQIGQIGVAFGSSYLATNNIGVQVDSLSPNCIMSTTATYTPANSNWFYWSIYGWTHSSYTYWGNTPNGWDNEFYVVCYTDMTAAAILANPGCISIGSVNVDGVIYDCYVTPRTSQSQWLAVARTKSFSASVNLQKIFAYWRSKGMANDYVVSLGWALEGFNGSAGTIQLSNIVIPNLTLNTVSH